MDYDLLVIGGGAAGLTSAGIGANFGAKTAMIEAHRLGGDCTWTGCMPSKALLQAAHVAHAMKTASRYGITSVTPEVDFRAVMEQVHETVLEIYHDADDPQIFRDMGIDVKFGRARFIDPHTVELDGEDAGRFSARKIIIAAGSKASVPPIEGLRDAGFLTNETLFELREQPSRLVIIGAGPIGCEMAQAFQRLGTDVTVVDRASRILGKDDPELAGMLREHLEAEGVRFVLDADVQRIEAGDLGKGDTGKRVHIAAGGETHVIESDELLIAAGRTPNTASLNLEAAGVVCGPHGITIDQRCRTNVEHIFAVGDIALTHKFTHMAEHSAKTAATNALLKLPMKLDLAHIPWVTFTTPELAHLGQSEEELLKAGLSFQTYRFPYTKVDRAAAEGKTTGLIKVYAKPLSGKILGADILGEQAGEQISQFALAMKNGVTLRQMADTIHPYPTYALGSRRAADQWYIGTQKEWMVRGIQKVFGYRGDVPDLDDPNRVV